MGKERKGNGRKREKKKKKIGRQAGRKEKKREGKKKKEKKKVGRQAEREGRREDKLPKEDRFKRVFLQKKEKKNRPIQTNSDARERAGIALVFSLASVGQPCKVDHIRKWTLPRTTIL